MTLSTKTQLKRPLPTGELGNEMNGIVPPPKLERVENRRYDSHAGLEIPESKRAIVSQLKDGEVLISRQFFVTLLSMVNVTNISEFLTSDHVHFPYPSNTEDELKHIMHPNPEPVAFNPPPPSLVTTLRTPIVIPFDSVKSHSIIRQLNVPPTVVKTDKLGLSFLSRLFPDSAVGMSM
ncbi:hypothetical protein AV274_0307 [Blastocystis sp. ATCC 50177/Nand II]|uniref:Uncharacterized protein n=1 Tax=Blastocystis sp. subtype 1 (strain ATCC 50177 / NandII) TaxID=478820 RepID=A0A196SQB4_BLAHN|nr:hypothetical protein AV274_0307 [Blastocystis sp. ATCC 50177/Nand II]